MTDDTSQEYSEYISKDDEKEMNTQEFDLTEVSEHSERVRQAAFAALMAALSLASAPIASVIPRIPGWEIALFDLKGNIL